MLEKENDFFSKDKNKKDGLNINCRSCCRNLYNDYRIKNESKEKERQKRYNKGKRNIDKEKMKVYKNEYYIKNKDRLSENAKTYRSENREFLNNRRKLNINRRLNDIISYSIRSGLKKINHRKNSRTKEILGCDLSEFKLYIESKFDTWMNWENWGKYNGEFNYGWDLDHIIPISSAQSKEDVIKLNHYTNLQPLCSKINRFIKADSINFNINI
jgi:hypothetical protein